MLCIKNSALRAIDNIILDQFDTSHSVECKILNLDRHDFSKAPMLRLEIRTRSNIALVLCFLKNQIYPKIEEDPRL